jgi:N-acetylglucosaminyl-diphospho-decaprenol L-rhamnosyltransferase
VDADLISAQTMNCSLDIIIVNWNAGGHLRDCLASIAHTRAGPEIRRVTVVDNASSDGSLYGFEDLPVPLEVIPNRHNVGFAAACNQGAAGSTADYLLFLNPDTRLFPETLEAVTRFMESERAREIGICGVQMVDGDGTPKVSCARFPSPRVLFGEMTGLGRFGSQLFPSHQFTGAEAERSQLVDQVIGAFYFVRRPLFVALGGFDERYFIYFEEADFALRARRHGSRSYFLKEARVFHAEHVSSDQVRDSRLYHVLRSRLLFAYKHWPRWQANLLLVATLTLELTARLVRSSARRSPADVFTTLSAYRLLVRELVGLATGLSPRSSRCADTAGPTSGGGS